MLLTASTTVRNPNPTLPPFLAPLMEIYDWVAGAGLWLSAIAIIVAAIALVFARFTGGVGRVVGNIVGVIAGLVLILNAGTFLGMFS